MDDEDFKTTYHRVVRYNVKAEPKQTNKIFRLIWNTILTEVFPFT